MGAGADGSADDGIAFGFRQKSLEIYRYGMDDCTCARLPSGVRHAGACREDGGARTGRNPNLPEPGFSSFYPYDFLCGCSETIMAQWSSAFMEKAVGLEKVIGDVAA